MRDWLKSIEAYLRVVHLSGRPIRIFGVSRLFPCLYTPKDLGDVSGIMAPSHITYLIGKIGTYVKNVYGVSLGTLPNTALAQDAQVGDLR